jgi:RecA-family ATPase
MSSLRLGGVVGDMDETLRSGGEAAVLDRLAKAKRLEPDDTSNVISLSDHVRDDSSTATRRTLPWLDMSGWDDEPTPERDWCIFNRVPAEQFGLFSGEGGTGKSIIELTKNVAHVTGKDWFGSLPEIGPTLYIGTEETEKELHIRVKSIALHYGVTVTELIAGGFRILPLIEDDATLVRVSGKGGTLEATPLYNQIVEAAGDIKPINVSIDPLSAVFAGNEIDRTHAYAFRRFMLAIAKASRAERHTGATFGGSVTLLAHPSLAGISSGTGLSGSTGWHGAPRFRQYLKGVKDAEGEQEQSDLRELQFKKVQYGPASESLMLRYHHGVFVQVGGPSDLEKAARDAKVEDIFIKTAKRLLTLQELSPAHTSHSYAVTVISRQPEAKGIRKAELADAMTRLIERGKVQVETLNEGTTRQKKVIRV